MNKGLVIGIVVLILLLLGGYFMFAGRSTGPTAPTPFSGESAPRTLADLVGLGSQMCTYEDPETGDTGTFYVGSGSMRGDVSTTVDGTTQVSHMIYTDNTMYIWADGETTGVKMTANFEDEGDYDVPDSDTGVQTPEVFDADREIDYDCGSWRVDSSLFELPGGIEFVDFSTFSMPSESANGEAGDQCAVCDSLTGESQDACLASLGC